MRPKNLFVPGTEKVSSDRTVPEITLPLQLLLGPIQLGGGFRAAEGPGLGESTLPRPPWGVHCRVPQTTPLALASLAVFL